MRERQRPGAPGLAVTGGTVAIGLCLLALAAVPARASESSVAAEPSPHTTGEGEAPANVKPDPPPQATERTSRPPGESTQSSGQSTQSVTSVSPPSGASPPPRAPDRPVVTHTPPAEAAPTTRSVTATAPATTRAAAARRAHARRRKRAGPARDTVRGPHHARSPVTGATAVAPASGRRQGLLLLLASLASAVLMLASLTLLRLVKRLGGTLSAGSSP
jgi:hypothetical protein